MNAPAAATPAPAPAKRARLLHAVLAGLATVWITFSLLDIALVAVSPLAVPLTSVVGALWYGRWPLAWARVVLPLAAGLLAMWVLARLFSIAAIVGPPLLFVGAGLAALVATVHLQRTHTLTMVWSRRRSA